MRAVRFDHYGPVDVLDVVEVDEPRPGPGQVRVRVAATSINPGESQIREGAMAERAPSTFPSGQGSDLAGVVDWLGDGVQDWAVGDEVVGWTDDRTAQAELVIVDAAHLTRRPPGVAWEQVAGLYVAGCTAYQLVQRGGVSASDTVVLAGATGGVGSIAVQLLRRTDARVLAVAGPDNDAWLRSMGAEPVNHGDDLLQRLRQAAPDGVDALLDCFGGGYVQMGLDLGVEPSRIVTIIDFDTAQRVGAQSFTSYQQASAEQVGELAAMIERGQLMVPVDRVYPLDEVRDAYTQLERRHTRGKIVLRVSA